MGTPFHYTKRGRRPILSGKELVEVYKELKETYPKCLPRVIQNKHLANYMRMMKPKVKEPKVKELMIEWQGLKQER